MLAIATISPTPNMELPPQYNGFVSENARLPRDIDDTELKKRMEKYQMEEIDNAEYELPEEYWEFVFLYAKLPKPL